MRELFKVMLSLSLSGAVLTVAILLCNRLLRNRVSKRWQYTIWLIVVVRLLFPFTPAQGILPALWEREPPTQNEFAEMQDIPDTQASPAALPSEAQPASPENQSSAPQGSAEWQEVWSFLSRYAWTAWLAVAMGMLLRKVTLYQSFVKYLRAGERPVEDLDTLNRFGVLCEQLRLKQPVELATNHLIASPLMLGFVRPSVVLPALPEDEADFRYICLHELTHCKRRDIFYKWLVQVVLCIHWFNPLVHLMVREVGRACELSCDEAVLHLLDARERSEYGSALLQSLKTPGTYREGVAALTLNEGASSLKERLAAIMKYHRPSRGMVVAAVLLAILLFAGGYALGAYTAEPEAPSQEENSGLSPEGLPVMSAVNREMFETYVSPVVVTGLLRVDFTPEDISALVANDGNILESVLAAMRPELFAQYAGAFPASVAEEALMAILPVRAENIQTAFAPFYDEDTDAYALYGGLGGGPATPIVTGSSQEGDLLTIYYTWYSGDPAEDEFRYREDDTGVLIIRLEKEEYQYVSNKVMEAQEPSAGQNSPNESGAMKAEILPLLEELMAAYENGELQGVDYGAVPEYAYVPTIKSTDDFSLATNEMGLVATIPLTGASEWQMEVLLSNFDGTWRTSGAAFNIVPGSFMEKAMARGLSFTQVRTLVNQGFSEADILTLPMEDLKRTFSQFAATNNVDERGFVTLGYASLVDMTGENWAMVYPGEEYLGLTVNAAQTIGIPYGIYVMEAEKMAVSFTGEIQATGSLSKENDRVIFTVAEQSLSLLPACEFSLSREIVLLDTPEMQKMLAPLEEGKHLQLTLADYSIAYTATLRIDEAGDPVVENPQLMMQATLAGVN
jgi:beta-lactamase regulating signal transducer with metallopeptidase domain